MKRAFQLTLIFLSVLLISCNKSTTSPSLVGTSNCEISGGVMNNIPCEMDVAESGGVFTITVSGSQINPNIVLTGTESGGDVLIDACSECYQDDVDVNSGGVLSNSSGSKILTFGFYNSGEIESLVDVTVKEI